MSLVLVMFSFLTLYAMSVVPLKALYTRPQSPPRKNFLRYIVNFPTLSGAVAVIVTTGLLNMFYDTHNYTTDVHITMSYGTALLILWTTFCEEVAFRLVMRYLVGSSGFLVYVYTSYLNVLLWFLLSGGQLQTLYIFFILGLTYGYGSEKYMVSELILFRYTLYMVAIYI